MQHIAQAEKPSEQVSARHLRHRTTKIKKVGDTVNSGEMDRHIIKLLRKESTDEHKRRLTEALGSELTLELPERETLSMKEDVGLSWFRLNKLRRYMYFTNRILFFNTVYCSQLLACKAKSLSFPSYT